MVHRLTKPLRNISTDASCLPSISYLWMFVPMWMEAGSVVQIGCVRRSDQAPCGGK